MKKIIFFLICSVMILGVATGCGNKQIPIETDNNNSSNINKNKTGYQVKINNEEFYFPCKLEKLLNIGFSIDEKNKQRVLSTTEDYIYVDLENNKKWLGVIFGVYIKPNGNNIKNAIVLGLKMAPEFEDDLIYYIEGLEVSEITTVKDVVNKLGQPEEPTTYDENAYILAFIYRKDNVQLTFSFVSGKLNSVYLSPKRK